MANRLTEFHQFGKEIEETIVKETAELNTSTSR